MTTRGHGPLLRVAMDPDQVLRKHAFEKLHPSVTIVSSAARIFQALITPASGCGEKVLTDDTLKALLDRLEKLEEEGELYAM